MGNTYQTKAIDPIPDYEQREAAQPAKFSIPEVRQRVDELKDFIKRLDEYYTCYTDSYGLHEYVKRSVKLLQQGVDKESKLLRKEWWDELERDLSDIESKFECFRDSVFDDDKLQKAINCFKDAVRSVHRNVGAKALEPKGAQRRQIARDSLRALADSQEDVRTIRTRLTKLIRDFLNEIKYIAGDIEHIIIADENAGKPTTQKRSAAGEYRTGEVTTQVSRVDIPSAKELMAQK